MSEVDLHEPWEIPASWAWQHIGDVCAVIGGATPATGDPRNFNGGDVPWVTPADLSGYREKYIERGERNITKAGLDSSSARLLPKGSVLFSSRAPVGYVAIAARPLATNQGFKSFVPPKGIVSDYLYYFLQRAKSLALKLASGTTFQEVSGKRAAQIPLAIAPSREQPRIVAKLEELFSDLDASVAALERARANLKRYRAAVLKAAVEGRLTAQWRKTHSVAEPASQLLERILAGRRKKWEAAQLSKFAAAGKAPPKGWKDKYPEPAKPDTANLPDLPEGWCWASVEQVSQLQRYGSSAKTSETVKGVPVLRMGNIQDGGLDLKKLKYLPEEHYEFPELLLKKGDVLFNRTNSAELVGKTAVYKGLPERCSFASYLIGVRLIAGCMPEYLSCFINSMYGRQWIASVVSQQVGQANVNGTKLAALVFPLPPEDEQRTITSLMEERLSIAEKSVIELARGLERTSRLRQSILKRAFEGKLVPQDPSDEPASVLLERIRAARAGSSATPRARKPRRARA